jgi:uncharacterized protein YndB with AHSA1/START domain
VRPVAHGYDPVRPVRGLTAVVCGRYHAGMSESPGWLVDTHREQRRRVIAAGAARTALIRVRCRGEIEDAWEAWTKPERLALWFGKVSGDFRVGGAVLFNPDEEDPTTITIVRCEAPERLTVTWQYPGRPLDEVDLRLSVSAFGGTVIEVEHASVLYAGEGVGVAWEWWLDRFAAVMGGKEPDADEAVVEERVKLRQATWEAIVAADA